MWRVVAAVTVVGCGFSGPPGAVGADPEIDAAVGSDAGTDAAVALGPWGTPRRLTEIEDALWGDLATVEYDDPVISDSGEMLFATSSGDLRTQNADVYRAVRNASGLFESVEPVPGLSTIGFETTPHISPDGLTAMVSSDGNLFISTRNAESDPWPAMQPIPEATPGEINTISTEALGWLSPDGERLYFSSNRAPGIDFDVYLATRDGNGDYGGVTALAGPINTAGDQFSPKLSADELTIYLTEMGGVGFGVSAATRATATGDFTVSQPVAELNDPNFDDVDFAPSRDHRTGVFSSNRHSQTSMRLYITER